MNTLELSTELIRKLVDLETDDVALDMSSLATALVLYAQEIGTDKEKFLVTVAHTWDLIEAGKADLAKQVKH